MMIKQLINWYSSKRRAFRIGIILGLCHFAFIMIPVYLIVTDPRAQWQLLWIGPMFIDFPVSVLTFLILLLLPNMYVPFLPYPIGSVREFIFPLLIHGILGSLWYVYLSVLVANIRRRIAKK